MFLGISDIKNNKLKSVQGKGVPPGNMDILISKFDDACIKLICHNGIHEDYIALGKLIIHTLKSYYSQKHRNMAEWRSCLRLLTPSLHQSCGG